VALTRTSSPHATAAQTSHGAAIESARTRRSVGQAVVQARSLRGIEHGLAAAAAARGAIAAGIPRSETGARLEADPFRAALRAAFDGGQTRSSIFETDAIRRQGARQGVALERRVRDWFIDGAIRGADLSLRVHRSVPLRAEVPLRLARVARSLAGKLDVLAAASYAQNDEPDSKPTSSRRNPEESLPIVRTG
jgi:hypothetical protein